MTISMYQASVPHFDRHLDALEAILDKAAAYCESRKIDPAALLTARLYPDMFNFTRQVQSSCDFAKGAAARLAGVEVPSHPDTETSIADLKARIVKTRAFLATITPAAMEGSETRTITMKVGPNERSWSGLDYLLGFALPNFYFHCTTAYGILRHNGLEVGKRDFMRRAA